MFGWRKGFYFLAVLICLMFLFSSFYFGLKAFQYDADTAAEAVFRKPKHHLVLICQELGNPYWRLVEEGARKAAAERGVVIEYRGPIEADTEEHIKILEMAIAARVDGILTQGLTDREFTPVINKAVEKGIPVITVDTDAPNSKRLSYVGTDNYRAGYLAGRAMVERTGGRAIVGIVTGSLTANHQILRVQGFRDAVQGSPGIRIAAVEDSNISRIEAAEKAYRILRDHPDVTAFYGTSALDGLGIAQVVQRLAPEGRKYTIIAFDTLPETLALMKRGIIDATVVQYPYMMGYQSVHLMVDHLEGKPIPALVHTETKVIGKEDLDGLDSEMGGEGT